MKHLFLFKYLAKSKDKMNEVSNQYLVIAPLASITRLTRREMERHKSL
jgi:hypothetical protein